MRRFVFLLFGIAFVNGFSLQHKRLRFKRQATHAAHRQRYPIPTNTQTTADGVPILAQPYANSRLTSTSTRQLQPSNPDHGLSLYDDFVNDPWKPTQDLPSLTSERRPQPTPPRDLRSGHHTDHPRDNLWDRRPAYGQSWSDSYATTRAPLRQTESPAAHKIGQERSGPWSVSSRSGDHITYVKQRSSSDGVGRVLGSEEGWREAHSGGGGERMRSWDNQPRRSPPYGENGDAVWIVESRSDGHVTYRRRGTQGSHPNRLHETTIAPIQRLGQGRGEVLARVVKTGSDEATAFELRRRQPTNGNSHLASYKSMQQNYAHSPTQGEGSFSPQGWKPTLQLKSGDSVSYLTEDGSEVVYPRFRDGESVIKPRQRIPLQPQPTVSVYTPTNSPPLQRQRFEQEGDWRVVSKDGSHITWNRVGSEATSLRPYYYTRPTQSALQSHHASSNEGRPWYRETRTSGGPHYPMLHDKETAERAKRLGTTNAMTLVY